MDQQQAVLQTFILTRRSVENTSKNLFRMMYWKRSWKQDFGRPAPATTRLGIYRDDKQDTIDKWNEAGKQWMAHCGRESQQNWPRPGTTCVFHAPCVAFAYPYKRTQAGTATGERWMRPWPQENIMLAAHAMGLGSCYIGWFTPWLKSGAASELLQDMPLPEYCQPFHFITLGYPEQVGPAPKRNGGLYRLFG